MKAAHEHLKMLIAGVGGQGVLTVSRYLGEAARRSGQEVVLGQLHGMSQRGGNVEATVIMGGAESSFIGDGGADIVLGLEPLETLRARPKMAAHTRVVTNLGRIVPHVLTQQGRAYPDTDEILSAIRAIVSDLVAVDATAIARKLGVPRVANIAMLGVLAGLDILPFTADALADVVEEHSPTKYLEANRRAFELGAQEVKRWTSRSGSM